jgi:hypothetical protein
VNLGIILGVVGVAWINDLIGLNEVLEGINVRFIEVMQEIMLLL